MFGSFAGEMLNKHWFVRVTCVTIFIGLCLGSFRPSVNAQDIPTGQPTYTPEIQLTETPTNEPPPTETPVPADTPTDTPSAIETSTPENSPTPEIIPSETAAETATVDLTTTITPTETAILTITPTLTPTETAVEENWRIEYDLFYPSALLANMGGEGAAEAELRNFLSILDSEQDVTYDLGFTTEGEGSLYELVIEGSGGFEQFRHIYMDSLAPRFGTISGITQLWISSSGNSIPEWQLALDSNITTGYNWHIVEASGITVSSESYQDGASSEIGEVGRQYFTLENDGSGPYSISLKYSSPWEADTPPARRIYLDISLPEEINLATPEIISFAALSAPAPEELSLLQSGLEMDMLGPVPESFDWRDSGDVPPIRNQGSCGSCYAFATVGVMESAMLINGISADLSEQFLVSCTQGTGYINHGCDGGRPDSHIYHVGTLAKAQSAAGAVLESSMPYTASDSTCYAVDHPYRLMSWHTVNPTWNTIPDADTLKNIIFNNGPVAASICSLSAFHSYDSGIFTTNETCSGSRTNHAVMLTGWITDPTHGTVWILRNSWGSGWGDGGYMYIKAGTSSIGWNATYVEYKPQEDLTPPKVSNLDSFAHTSDNSVVNNEDISVGVTQLLVSFNESMYYANGVNDILTLSNYSLTNLGADDQPGGGDDTQVVINSATYNVSTRIATLNFNNNTNLPNAAYQFKISGSGTVKDGSDLPLDGDGNGVAGGDYVINFKVSAKPGLPLLTAPITGFVTNDTTPELSWSSANDAASYEIVIAKDSAFTLITHTGNSGSALTFTTPVLPDGKYYWRVRGINHFGVTGSWSAARTITIDTIPPAVPALYLPADLSSSRGTPQYSWNASSGALYYQLRTLTTPGDVIYTSPELATRTLRPPDQPLGTQLWDVRARDLAGNWSSWSTQRALLIKPYIPAAPALYAPLNTLWMMNSTPSLDWSDVIDGTMYEFQVSSSNTFKPIIQGGTTPSSEFSLISLADGKYYWRVRALNVDNEPGSWSGIRYFYIDNVAPSIPALNVPRANTISKGTPIYYWNGVSTAAFYQFRYLATDGTILHTSLEIKATSYKPPTQPIGTYLWQVRVRDIAGNWSGWSGTRSIEIQAPVTVGPVLNSPVNGLAMINRTPTLDWSEVPYGVMYEYQISKGSSFIPLLHSGKTTDTEIALASLADGRYYWRVRAINDYNQPGRWSGIRYFYVDNVAPSIPTLNIPRANTISKGTPTYYWYGVSSGAYYQFQYSATDGTILHTSPESKATKYKPPTQAIGTYLWQVRVRDAAGNWSDWSGTRSIEIQAPVTVGPVLNSPVNGLAMKNRIPTLNWSEVPYGVMYEYQISTGSSFIPLLQSGQTANTEVTLTSLADGRYYWRVRAINDYNQPGRWSGIRYFYVDNIAPAVPALYLPANNKINFGTPIYYWRSVSSGAYYQYRYTTTTGTVIYTSPETKATKHKPPTQPIGTYLWQVRARDAAGNWSDWSSTRTIEIKAPVPATPKLTFPINYSVVNDSTPLLSWTETEYATSYEVQISLTKGFTAIVQQSAVTGVNEYTASPLLTSRFSYYYWRVRSINAYGQKSGWSAYRYFKVIP